MAKTPTAATSTRLWDSMAQQLEWIQPYHTVCEGHGPQARWFSGGVINVAANCLDRHLPTPLKDKTALIWESEEGIVRSYTYAQLTTQVSKAANVLKKLGVKKGDRVAIYLGAIPELPIAMLACARIGAIHSVIFAGFAADSLKTRLNDLSANLIITAQAAVRRGKIVPLLSVVESVKKECPTLQKTVLIGSTATPLPEATWSWEALMQEAKTSCPAEPMAANDPLFVLYTSGTTGKPKGIVHGVGGYLVGVMATFRWVFEPQTEDVYWCTADPGWITGHSYGVYGPLSTGSTVFMYEGAPDYPAPDQIWRLCEKHAVTILYTAPTLIRTFEGRGQHPCKEHTLTALRLLGSVGEAIGPVDWHWYHQEVGNGRCPIQDTWWQTETGHILIYPQFPASAAAKPGSAGKPIPGVQVKIVDESGKEMADGAKGFLVLAGEWPGRALGIWQDPKRYQKVYWSKFPGYYYTGDLAYRDKEADLWIQGRADDIIVVSGHNLSTVEIEMVLKQHDLVAEVAVVGQPDPLTGQAVVAFVVLVNQTDPTSFVPLLQTWVAHHISPIARPKEIICMDELPKTRSGKVLRRVLRSQLTGLQTE